MKLDGKEVADYIYHLIEVYLKNSDVTPNAVIYYNSEDYGSALYTRMKKNKAAELGIVINDIDVKDMTAEELRDDIKRLNEDDTVTGIMVQEPIGKFIDNDLEDGNFSNYIDFKKDIDGLSVKNQGALMQGDRTIYPATPRGVLWILRHYKIEIAGARVLVVGRSNLFGKPMAMMLTKLDATVTLAHSKTKDLDKYWGNYDIIILGTGQPGLLKSSVNTIQSGATIIDVGMSQVDGKATGDFELSEKHHASYYNYTPTPGGTGPTTIASLMYNIVITAGGVMKWQN